MKNKSANILIVSFLLLGIMSVLLIIFMGNSKEDFENNITVEADGVTEKVLAVRDLKLNPTESKDYSINLVCSASGSYLISLNYEEKSDGGMKSFVDVTIKRNSEVIYTGSLAELLDNGILIEFEGELQATTPLVLTITYLMPINVGNEAQGTYADFEVHLKIEKS